MKQIFLVEDDREIAKNLTLLLQAEGYGVVHASGQAEAAAMVEKARYDLALVDISLPDGSGFVVCTQIRQMQKIPVIFLTASGDEASVVTGLNMGADDYVIKPFRPRELIARIQAALRKSGFMTAGPASTKASCTACLNGFIGGRIRRLPGTGSGWRCANPFLPGMEGRSVRGTIQREALCFSSVFRKICREWNIVIYCFEKTVVRYSAVFSWKQTRIEK